MFRFAINYAFCDLCLHKCTQILNIHTKTVIIILYRGNLFIIMTEVPQIINGYLARVASFPWRDGKS